MDTRVRNVRLEGHIRQVLHRFPIHVTNGIAVTASPDGTVWLKGSTQNRADCDLICGTVKLLPGVTQVFCHIAPKTE